MFSLWMPKCATWYMPGCFARQLTLWDMCFGAIRRYLSVGLNYCLFFFIMSPWRRYGSLCRFVVAVRLFCDPNRLFLMSSWIVVYPRFFQCLYHSSDILFCPNLSCYPIRFRVASNINQCHRRKSPKYCLQIRFFTF